MEYLQSKDPTVGLFSQKLEIITKKDIQETNYDIDTLKKLAGLTPPAEKSIDDSWQLLIDSINNLLSEMVAVKSIYDFVVVCDANLETQTLNVAIQPKVQTSFVYIPIVITNP